MSKTRWIGRILLAIVALGLLIAAGFVIYRIGYIRGAGVTRASEGIQARIPERFRLPREKSGESPIWPRGLPGFPQNRLVPRSGFFSLFIGTRSVFSPIWLFLKVAFVALVLWLLYKAVTLIFRDKGWQLTFRSVPASDVTDVDPADESEG
jgi:hypothetical protein